MKVTPWEVSGSIDYEKLVKQFGTSHITDSLLRDIEKVAGEAHFMLRRKLFFSHRDLDKIIDDHKNDKEFALYTGRGPSGHTHIGHLVPWVFTKWLQDVFDVELYFQITDDEKFLYGQHSLEETTNYAKENLLDVIAVGFNPEKTKIFIDTQHVSKLYSTALKIAKLTTFSTAKAVFGFTESTNIGMNFFPAMQAAPCFLPSIDRKKSVRVLIPAAIDQDPYWRIARDVADRLKYPKPAAIHNMFLPSLQGPGTKMSSSIPDSAIFTTDSQDVAKKKIMKSFSGGAPSLKEHREKGGNPHVDSACQYLLYMFEEDDDKVKEIFSSYQKGELSSGEVKNMLAKKVCAFLENHQKKREHAKKHIEEFLFNSNS